MGRIFIEQNFKIFNHWRLHCTPTPGRQMFRSMPALQKSFTRFPVPNPQTESRNPNGYAFKPYLYSVHFSPLHHHPDNLSPEILPWPPNFASLILPLLSYHLYYNLFKTSQSLSSSLCSNVISMRAFLITLKLQPPNFP